MSRYLLGVDLIAGHYAEAPVDIDDVAEEQAVIMQAVADVVAEEVGLVAPALRPYAAVAPLTRVLKSELPDVTDEEWTRFALAMKTAGREDVSASGSLGMFEMRPRRLCDLGLMKNVKPGNTRATGSMKWSGEWIPPLSQKAFLSSAPIQYKAFCESMRRYLDGLLDGSITQEGIDLSTSGMLAVLHKCGPNGLKTWAAGERNRFKDTIALVSSANEIF